MGPPRLSALSLAHPCPLLASQGPGSGTPGSGTPHTPTPLQEPRHHVYTHRASLLGNVSQHEAHSKVSVRPSQSREAKPGSRRASRTCPLLSSHLPPGARTPLSLKQWGQHKRSPRPTSSPPAGQDRLWKCGRMSHLPVTRVARGWDPGCSLCCYSPSGQHP